MVVPKHFKAVAALLILGMLTHALMAFQEEPVFQGKKFSEWEAMLKVDSNYSKLSDAEKEKSSRSRRAGLIALELMANSLDKRILPSMVLVLKNDPEEKLRETAALSLTRVALKMSEKTKSSSTRQYAAEVLKESLEKDKSIRVKEIAASSLGKMVPESAPAIPALILAMKQKDTGLRVAAVDALRRLGPEAKDAAPDLRALASDSTADIISKSFAFLALGNLKDVAAIPVLLQTVQDAKMPLELRLPAANAISMMGGESGGGDCREVGTALNRRRHPERFENCVVNYAR